MRVVRTVDAEGGVAELGGLKNSDLHVVPLHVVGGHVDLQAVIEELGFHADLVVGQRIGRVALGFLYCGSVGAGAIRICLVATGG